MGVTRTLLILRSSILRNSVKSIFLRIHLRTFQRGFSTPSTFAITGSEKRCAEGVPLFTVRVDGGVYAQHGHELMGWKSPVGGFNVDHVVDVHND